MKKKTFLEGMKYCKIRCITYLNLFVIFIKNKILIPFREFIGKDVIKNFLILLILYWLVSFTYSLFSGIGVDKFYDKQIEQHIKKDIGNKDYKINIIKKDIKGLGSDSIIIVLGYPWKDGIYDENTQYSGSKLIIYDKVQKDSLESLLFDSDLYAKSYELEIFPGYQDTEKFIAYGMDFMSFLEIDGGIGLQWQDMNGGSSTIDYYGILSYNWSYGKYEINSLLDDDFPLQVKENLNCGEGEYKYEKEFSEDENRQMEEKYNLCKEKKITLFTNELVNFRENGRERKYKLTAMWSDNYVKFNNSKEITVFYSLRGIIDNPNFPKKDELFESHASAHNYLEIKYIKNGLQFSNYYYNKYQIHYDIDDWIKLDELASE